MEELKRLALGLKNARLQEAAGLMIAKHAKDDQEDWKKRIIDTIGLKDGRLFIEILDGLDGSADTVTEAARSGWTASKTVLLKAVGGG